MKKKYTVAAALALSLAFTAPQAVMAGEHGGGQASVSGSLSVGASFNDDDDARTLSSEYSSLGDVDTREVVGGSIAIHAGKSAAGLEGMYLGPDEQEYEGHLNLDRILDIHGSYQEFWHRTGQDNLLNMEAETSGPEQGALLWHTYEYAPGYGTAASGDTNDMVPEHEFGVSRKELEVTGKIRFPQVPGLTVGVHSRQERREGNEQVMSMSKCASCHIVAHDKRVDETTQDIMPFVRYNVGKLSLEYSYLNRKFEDSSDPVTAHYDDAYNPLNGGLSNIPSRIAYENTDLEVARTPDTRKEVHSVKAKYDISGYQNVYAGYVYANMENNDVAEASASPDGVTYGRSSLETDYSAGMFSWHNRFSKNMMVNVKGRYQTIDSDDIFIDFAVDDGVTSHDETDGFVRESDEDRDVMTLKADLRYRLNRDITLRGGLEYEDEDRKNIEFLVSQDTTTYRGKAGLSWRLARNLRLRADYRLTYVDDPYTWEDAVYPNDGSLPYDGVDLTSPDTYSNVVYGTRSLNTSADPEMEHDLRVKANWNIGSGMNLGAYAKYTLGENDEDINYDYEDEVVDSGLDFTFSPMRRMTASLGYNYYQHTTDAAFYIPVYHG